MDDLVKYYYNTIDKDKDTIEKLKSKKAIAQRQHIIKIKQILSTGIITT